MEGYEGVHRYLVMDVEWDKKETYGYEVRDLTKKGSLHKGRYGYTMYPSNRISIEACSEPLDEETSRMAVYLRAACKGRQQDVLERGRLELFDEDLKRLRY